jgi:hypothetical protein
MSPQRDSLRDVDRARRRASIQRILGLLTRKPSDLLPFEQVREQLRLHSHHFRGLREVPLDQIVGSVGRYRDFTRTFLPRSGGLRERWATVEGRVVSAGEMLEITYDRPFPYPSQWLELLQAPCCGDVMIVVDKYAFFRDKPWVITTHRGPSRGEMGTSLLAVSPQHPETGITYGRQLACGSIGHLYNSLCRILCGRPPALPRPGGLRVTKPEVDLLFGTTQTHDWRVSH